VVRRTVSLPDSVDEKVRQAAGDEESFSAAVARLLEAGLRATAGRHRPDWVGSGEGPEDLGRRAEGYLRHPTADR
jgi:hypothetical protein